MCSHAQDEWMQSGEQTFEHLIRLLNHWESAIRQIAAQKLGELRDVRAVEPLIHAFKDDDGMVRRAAAIALGQIGDKRALEPLVHALNKDADRVVRRRAATALGQLGDKRAIEPLINALKDTQSGVPGYAALALDKLKEPWLQPFSERLNERDREVRARIMLSLAHFEFNGQRPFGSFVAALKD